MSPYSSSLFSSSTGYLGSVDAGKDYDATELIKDYSGPKQEILVDQGEADVFLAEQLLVDNFKAAADSAGVPVTLRKHEVS